MARTRATIKTSVWSDDDFCTLTAAAQRLYWLLLAQPRLSLAGHIDYTPGRWARLAPDTTLEAITDAVTELTDARFIAVDEATEELVIRSFIAHDINPGRLSSKVTGGLWSAWESILSPRLRALVVENIPDRTWEPLGQTAPPEALQMRRSAPIEREPAPPIDREPDPPIERDEAVPIERELSVPIDTRTRARARATSASASASTSATAPAQVVSPAGRDTPPEPTDDDESRTLVWLVAKARAERVHPGKPPSDALIAAITRGLDPAACERLRDRLTPAEIEQHLDTPPTPKPDRSSDGNAAQTRTPLRVIHDVMADHQPPPNLERSHDGPAAARAAIHRDQP